MNLSRLVPALPLLAVLAFPALATASDDDSAAIRKAGAAVDMFKKADPSLDKFFKSAKLAELSKARRANEGKGT